MARYATKVRRLGLPDAEIARRVGCSSVTATLIRLEERDAGLALALAFERAFPGVIRAEDLPMKARTRVALKALRTSHPSVSAA